MQLARNSSKLQPPRRPMRGRPEWYNISHVLVSYTGQDVGWEQHELKKGSLMLLLVGVLLPTLMCLGFSLSWIHAYILGQWLSVSLWAIQNSVWPSGVLAPRHLLPLYISCVTPSHPASNSHVHHYHQRQSRSHAWNDHPVRRKQQKHVQILCGIAWYCCKILRIPPVLAGTAW